MSIFRCIQGWFVMKISPVANKSGRGALAAATAAVLLATGVARAADLAVAPSRAAYDWSGFYLGLNAGYAGATVNEQASGGATGSASTSVPGGIGGLQLGYNYQIGAVVLGFETDFDGNMATKSSTSFGTVSGTYQIPWIGTLRGRAGVAFDRYLIYATAGGVASELNATVNVNGIGSATTANTFAGWTAGAGLEAALTDRVSARIEYLYVAGPNFTIAQVGPPTTTITGRVQDNLVRAGLNYRLPIVP